MFNFFKKKPVIEEVPKKEPEEEVYIFPEPMYTHVVIEKFKKSDNLWFIAFVIANKDIPPNLLAKGVNKTTLKFIF